MVHGEQEVFISMGKDIHLQARMAIVDLVILIDDNRSAVAFLRYE